MIIDHIDLYRDGGTVSIKLKSWTALAIRCNDDPAICDALTMFKEICVNHYCGDGWEHKQGQMTIGYPLDKHSIILSDPELIEWILKKSKEHVKYQKHAVEKAEESIGKFLKRKWFLDN